jgi:hypothetical protein
MVKTLTEKPTAFEYAQEGDVYFAMVDEAGEAYAFATLNYSYPPVAIIHLEVKRERFTHNLFKSAVKEDWPIIINECLANGCDIVHVNKKGTFESNASWMKFIRHFGFDNFMEYTAAVQTIGDKANGKTV